MSPVSTWSPCRQRPRTSSARSGRPRRSRSGDLRPHASDQRRRARRARRCRAPPTHPHRGARRRPRRRSRRAGDGCGGSRPTGSRTGCSSPRGCRRGPHHRQPAHVVAEGRSAEEGGSGRSSSKLRENTRASTTADNPARVLSSPSRLRQPNRHRRPRRPMTIRVVVPLAPEDRRVGQRRGHGQTLLPTAASSVWLATCECLNATIRAPNRRSGAPTPSLVEGRT